MDKEVVIERLEMLISLISETEPENPNDRELFSHHAIKTQENVKWLRDIITGRETPQQDNYREIFKYFSLRFLLKVSGKSAIKLYFRLLIEKSILYACNIKISFLL